MTALELAGAAATLLGVAVFGLLVPYLVAYFKTFGLSLSEMPLDGRSILLHGALAPTLVTTVGVGVCGWFLARRSGPATSRDPLIASLALAFGGASLAAIDPDAVGPIWRNPWVIQAAGLLLGLGPLVLGTVLLLRHSRLPEAVRRWVSQATIAFAVSSVITAAAWWRGSASTATLWMALSASCLFLGAAVPTVPGVALSRRRDPWLLLIVLACAALVIQPQGVAAGRRDAERVLHRNQDALYETSTWQRFAAVGDDLELWRVTYAPPQAFATPLVGHAVTVVAKTEGGVTVVDNTSCRIVELPRMDGVLVRDDGSAASDCRSRGLGAATGLDSVPITSRDALVLVTVIGGVGLVLLVTRRRHRQPGS